VFICGLISQNFDEAVKDVCNKNGEYYNWTVCRTCPSPTCDYSKLGDSCNDLRFTRVFDNGGATFFSIFMAIWAIVFLEFWKRYQADLCARWDVSEHEFGEEQVRPDYQLSVTHTKMNPVTKQIEPYLPSKTKTQRLVASFISVLFFIFVVIALLASIFVYRILGPMAWDKIIDEDHSPISPTLATSLTSSIINGIFIAVMTKVYMMVAWRLTSAEMPRTETEFEESYTYKVFIFQFVNFYGALFYLAFIRGQFNPSPRDQGLMTASCGATGCLLDVTIQLFIIFTGKQAINNAMELGIPLFKHWCKSRKHKDETEDNKYTRWEKDHDLEAPHGICLFGDYLEMLIQYGFVTMFVPAFPLAPLFALVNNIIEIRLDAFKNLAETQRMIPVRAKDIGPWFNLLSIITKVAIITNACLIALTTDFVDQVVYRAVYEGETVNNMSTSGKTYVDFVFTTFDTSQWKRCREEAAGEVSANDTSGIAVSCDQLNWWNDENETVSSCHFRDYRDASDKYKRTAVWWHVVLAKMVFILLFEHFILLVQALLQYLIPDVPEHVTIRVQREAFIQRQQFIKHEFGEGGVKPEIIEEEEEDEDVESEHDEKSSYALESFAGNLPPEVTANQLQKVKEKQAANPKKDLKQRRPFAVMLFKKLLLC
jgi:hypothetical protein